MSQQEHEELKKRFESLQKENKLLNQKNEEITRQRDELLSQSKTAEKINRHSDEFWEEVMEKFNETNYIKSLMLNNTITKNDTDSYGHALLHYAAGGSAYEIAQLCINLGYDLQHKNNDGKTALDIAIEEGAADTEQLLRFAETGANAGDRIKDIAFILNKQRGINENILNELSLIGKQNKELFENTLMEIMINIICKRLAFSDQLLNYCINSICEKNNDLFESELWLQINKTCNEIIKNGNKRDWFWLKEYIVKSTIWYRFYNGKLVDDKKEEEDNDGKVNDNDAKVNDNDGKYLYYKLLEMTIMKESNLKQKLERDINVHKEKNINDWNKLISYDISEDKIIKLKPISSTSTSTSTSTNSMTNIRQDNIPNGIKSQFSYDELMHKFPISSKFNSHKFYDYNQYLPMLQLLAYNVDDEFQQSIQMIYNINQSTKQGTISYETKQDIDSSITYVRGPIKLMERAKNKAENDYNNEYFPTTSCVLDFNRCTLIFNNISTLLHALDLFANKIKYYQSGNIIGIVRCKNMFKEYEKQTQYADIKLNVVIKGLQNNLVGEVQFLVKDMVNFKNKNHSLYAIQRQEEFIENSISKILPSLLNDNKQIWIASRLGDIDIFRNLMVHNNKNHKHIMIYNDDKECVLEGICDKSRIKILQYLMNVMPMDIFIQHFFAGAWKSVMSDHNFALIQKIYTNKQIQTYLEKHEDILFELITDAFVWCKNEDVIDLILTELSISNKKMTHLVNYKTEEEEDSLINKVISGNSSFNIVQKFIDIITVDTFKSKYQTDNQLVDLIHLFHSGGSEEIIHGVLNILNISDKTIIKALDVPMDDYYLIMGKSIDNYRCNALKVLLEHIGYDKFIQHVFVSDGMNRNTLECAIAHNYVLGQAKSLKYLLSFKEVKDTCLNDKEILWRIVYWMNESRDKQTVEYLKQELQLNEEKLRQLQSYNCSESFDYKKWENGLPEKYWRKDITDKAINKIINGEWV